LIISILMLAIWLNFLGIPTIKYLPQSKKLNKLLNTSKKSFWWFLLIWVITFFLPCGFTYTTQLLALSSGNGVRASLIMLSFVLWTTPILTVIWYSWFLINSWKTALGQILNYFIWWIIVIFALISLNFQLWVLYFPNINISGKSTTENNIETPVENWVIYMTYTKAWLSHSVIKLEAWKDYKIVISVKNTIYWCMSTIFLKWLDDKIQSLKAWTTVEFNIKQAKKWTYWFLCAMWAKHNAKVVVE
jgi:hypothetical protein